MGNEERPDGDKRLHGSNPFGESLFTERNWEIVSELNRIAQEAGQNPARVALAWETRRPAVTATLMGVSWVGQLLDNVAPLDIALSDAQIAALDKISLPQARMLYSLFTPTVRHHAVFGGDAVSAWGA